MANHSYQGEAPPNGIDRSTSGQAEGGGKWTKRKAGESGQVNNERNTLSLSHLLDSLCSCIAAMSFWEERNYLDFLYYIEISS